MDFIKKLTSDLTPDQIKQKLLILLIILICLFSIIYWFYGQLYVTTDDAYIGADVVQISSRVTGKVKKLLVENNQYVNANQLLFYLEKETFEAQLAEAKAGLLMAEAKVKIAQLTADRNIELVKQHAMSAQDGDIAISNLDATKAQRDIAKASLVNKELNLQYTNITSPANGWVTNMTLQVGDSVIANQPLFALVNDHKFWVDANFKEDQLKNIKIGQKVIVSVDMYKNHTFNGVVESFSSGSGNAFSLLPPENATGNWVKVTQRVPVRIKITNPSVDFPLRIGTSAIVKIYVNSLFNDKN